MEELQLAASSAAPQPSRSAREVAASTSASTVDAAPDVSASRWERMLNGGKKKKRSKESRAQRDESDAVHSEAMASGSKDELSVEASNALRISLGLKPLKE